MAKNKKAVVVYVDWIHVFEGLEDDEAGRLIKHFLRYVNDKNPEAPDKLTKIAFEPMRLQLKRDLKAWEDKCERNRLIALAGWQKRNDANASERIKSDAKNADTDTDTDTDTESVIQATPAILGSNLFRKPVIPTKAKVWEVFSIQGGTKEMAKKFFETNEGLGWFKNNSPITNFANLVPGYIQAWNENGKRKSHDHGSSSAPLSTPNQ